MNRLLICAAIVAATSARAEFMDGNKLLEQLQSTSAVTNGVGIGYILGVHDATRGDRHCSPASISAGQLKDMVTSALLRIPEKRHFMADVIVASVLSIEWPCPKKTPQPGSKSL